MSEKEKPRVCLACEKISLHKDKLLKSWLSDFGGTVFSSVSHRPNAKAHTVIMTKNHTETLKEMSSQEWADILPVLKDSIAKIDKVYHPLGYRIGIPVGRLAGQNQPPHFYMRVVPKYKKDWGTVSTSEKYKPVSPEEAKELQDTLQPNQDDVIIEKSKVIAKMHNETALGYTIISTKNHLSANINSVDSETWAQIGETMKDCMNKFETFRHCHNFIISFSLGEAGKIFESEKENKPYTSSDSNELKIVLFPKFKIERWWKKDEGRPVIKGQRAGTMEEERIAAKLRDPEGYAKAWGKADKQQQVTHLKEQLSQTKQQFSQTQQQSTQTHTKISPLWLILAVGLTAVVFWTLGNKKRDNK